jgi:hypothetical protein
MPGSPASLPIGTPYAFTKVVVGITEKAASGGAGNGV